MSHIYGAPILDVSRSHTTTQHTSVSYKILPGHHLSLFPDDGG